MTRGQAYSEKRDYADTLKEALMALTGFADVQYARSYITDEEYIRISDKVGGVAFLDVTAKTNGEILKDVCRVVLLDDPKHTLPEGLITDKAEMIRIAPLFG